MFSVSDMDTIFEQLAQMERKHTRDYYDELAMYHAEKNPERAESIMGLLLQEQARMEALQFAQGVVEHKMKSKGYWAGSEAEKINATTRKWAREQHRKSLEKGEQ